MIARIAFLSIILSFFLSSPLFADDPAPAGAASNAPAAAPASAPVPEAPANWAVVPIRNTAKDNYNFDQRHAAVLAAKDALKPQIVVIGDSITMRWGGPPDHGVRPSWTQAFGDVPTLNLGFGYDLTQNVLWRLDNGEFDGLAPKVVVIEIGTNNLTGAPGSHGTTPAETVEGILAICDRVKAKSPQSRIIVMAVFPRGAEPANAFRPRIAELNKGLAAALAARPEITLLDIGASFLQPDGTLPKEMMPDGVHPTEAGYAIWAKALVDAGVRN